MMIVKLWGRGVLYYLDGLGSLLEELISEQRFEWEESAKWRIWGKSSKQEEWQEMINK